MTRSTLIVLITFICFLFATNDSMAKKFGGTKLAISSSQISKDLVVNPQTPADIVDYFTELDMKKYSIQATLTTLIGQSNSTYGEGSPILVKSILNGNVLVSSLKGNLTAYKSTNRHNNCSNNGFYLPHPFNPAKSMSSSLLINNNKGNVGGVFGSQSFDIIGSMKASDGGFILYGKIKSRQGEEGLIAITLKEVPVVEPPK